MKEEKHMKIRIACAVCCVAVLFAVGCGGAQKATSVELAPRPMPEGGNFDGVFQSPAYGRMEFTVQGANVIGLYEGERHYGKIEGTINGDVLNFTWTQWKQDLQGKERTSTGHGYFRYIIDEEKTTASSKMVHKLNGEWGYDADNAGNPWKAVKLSDRTKKQLKPHNTGEGGEGVDMSQSAGFDTAAPTEEPSIEMGESKAPETQPSDVHQEKPAEGLDNLF
jgi:hypothetical protein